MTKKTTLFLVLSALLTLFPAFAVAQAKPGDGSPAQRLEVITAEARSDEAFVEWCRLCFEGRIKRQKGR